MIKKINKIPSDTKCHLATVKERGGIYFLGVYHGYSFDSQFILNYLMTYCSNFISALSVQLFIVGSSARYLFRVLFSTINGEEEKELSD
mgnify:FL=1